MTSLSPRGRMRVVLIEQYQLAAALADAMSHAFSPRRYERGAAVLRAGSRANELLFVAQGVLRLFYTTRDGKQHNKAFVSDGMFFVALSAHLRAEPVRFDVQALTRVEALSMPYAEFERWMAREPGLAGLWRRYMEAHFMRHEAREEVLQLEDARGRYRWFLAQHPRLVQRVPLYHIASYLGVTNVTLSRVRRGLHARARS